MANTVASVQVDFIAQTAAFQRSLDAVDKKVGKISGAMGSMEKAVSSAIMRFVTFEAARRAIVYLGETVMEVEQANAKLVATLRAVGDTAGQTKESISDFADEMERTTLFDDEEVKNAAAALLTFGNVGEDAFERTIRAAGDLSVIFGGTLADNVEKLGKALEDPEAGLTGLRKAGVIFSQTEKDVIKALIEHNRLAEAQAAILEKVEGKVRGNAEALGATGLTGSINMLKDAFENMLKSNLAFATDNSVPNWIKRVATAIEDYSLKRLLLLGPILGPLAPLAGIGIPDPFGGFNPRSFMGARPPAEGALGVTPSSVAPRGRPPRTKEQIAKDIAAATEAEKKAMKELEALSDETARIMENRWDQFTAGLEAAEDAEKEAAEAILAAEQKVFAEMERNAAALDQADKEFARAEGAKRWAASWGHAFEEIQDRFASGFERLLMGQIRSFRDFGQMILSIWAQTLAQMAAAQASAGLMSLGASLLGSFLGGGRYGGGVGGMVDSPSLPGMPSGGPVANMAGSPANINVSLSLVSLDPRSHADLIAQQEGTIVSTLVKAVQRSGALRAALARG